MIETIALILFIGANLAAIIFVSTVMIKDAVHTLTEGRRRRAWEAEAARRRQEQAERIAAWHNERIQNRGM